MIIRFGQWTREVVLYQAVGPQANEGTNVAPIHVVMGSESDAPLVKHYLTDLLRKIGVGFTTSVCSAHRDPEVLAWHIKEMTARDTMVYIGVAGLACALPGAIAANDRQAIVLAVPLDREEGLSSVIDMPPGVPVFTMGVGKTGLTKAAEGACIMLGKIISGVAALQLAYLQSLADKKPPKLNIDIDTLAAEVTAKKGA